MRYANEQSIEEAMSISMTVQQAEARYNQWHFVLKLQ